MSDAPLLEADVDIGVTLTQARAWFLSLADYPERYEFDTHRGFAFTQGKFGEVGARFETEELFHGLRVKLRFELTEVQDTRFGFRLRGSLRPYWGYFDIASVQPDLTRLTLAVGADGWLPRRLLRLPPVRGAVQQQIAAEVSHIKQAMESLYRDATWAD